MWCGLHCPSAKRARFQREDSKAILPSPAVNVTQASEPYARLLCHLHEFIREELQGEKPMAIIHNNCTVIAVGYCTLLWTGSPSWLKTVSTVQGTSDLREPPPCSTTVI